MLVTDIKYDTDGEDIDLPSTLNIDVPIGLDDIETDEYISDEISNITGYCHFGFVKNYNIEFVPAEYSN